MRWFAKISLRARSLFRKSAADSELDTELRFHLERQIATNISAGMSQAEARRAALREFGGVEGLKEECRDARETNYIHDFAQDMRYALRMLRKSPGFTAVAVLTLALGIGANTAIFSVVEAVFLRPLPYKDPGRLAMLTDPQDPKDGGFLYKDLETFKSQNRTFEGIAAYYRDSGFSRVTLVSDDGPEFIQGAFVSANFFSVMGVPPLLGRTFSANEEEGHDRLVVLSYGSWVRRFGASPYAIGKALQINGMDWQVIGVMPATFHFPAKDQQFWAPITTDPFWGDRALTTDTDPNHSRFFFDRWQAVGRLKPGIGRERAQSEFNAIFAGISTENPDTRRGNGVNVAALQINIAKDSRLSIWVLVFAVFFVLLIACTNVASLILARGVSRSREMALRAAVGAQRGRLIRQLFSESMLLALLSGCAALLLAEWGVHALISFGPSNIPRLDEARLDIGVFGFAFFVSSLAAVLFGLFPALKISRGNPGESLKSGIRGSIGLEVKHARSVLVVVEFALAVVLLAGAGLLIRSFLAIESVDTGFRAAHVLTMHISLPSGSPAAMSEFYDRVSKRIGAMPGVQAAGAADELFELGTLQNLGLRAIEGRAPEPQSQWTPLNWITVSGNYFQAMGVPLLAGRYFSTQDNKDSSLVAIIDQRMARRYWPGEDPLGKRFKGQDRRGRNDEWITVIGVVGSMRLEGLERNFVPHVYEWAGQGDNDFARDFIVRTARNPLTLAGAMRSAVRSVDNRAILSSVATMEEQIDDQLSPRRFQMWLVGLFSLIALLLATIGVYGVMHYSVAQRTHEIGIRMALGAQSGQVLSLILAQGLKLVLAGVAIGIVASLALTRLMSSLLFGVSATDPLAFFGVVILLTIAALLASYIPARRAMRVDPMVALRYE